MGWRAWWDAQGVTEVSRHLLVKPEALLRSHRLHDDAARHTLALGCGACVDLSECGGQRIAAASYSCMDRCCGGVEGCDVVCPRNPTVFVERHREVKGFRRCEVPRAPLHSLPLLPSTVPVLYGGTGRSLYTGPAVALPLSKVLCRADGHPRFRSMAEMADRFRFAPGAAVVLTATSDDRPLEGWWKWGAAGRRRAVRALATLGVCAATSPNFSLFTDRPRFDDLHSMKRIALTWQEMVDEGLPVALHVNARTEADWSGWTAFVVGRPEVDAVAFEFATPARIQWHAAQLSQLARNAGRPLRLLLRGGRTVVPLLRSAFAEVVLLDTTAYMRTMKRQRGHMRPNGRLGWVGETTLPGHLLDDLFEHNLRLVDASIAREVSTAVPAPRHHVMRRSGAWQVTAAKNPGQLSFWTSL